jgi:molecular chaperone DnaK (HSP70)
MLKKNSALPCYKEQMFYTMNKGQTALEIAVTQGEDKDVKFVNTIARHKLDLPPNRDSECPIKVRYSYDLNQRMHCQFEDLQSGKLLEIDLEMNDNGQAKSGTLEEKVRQLQAYEVK